MRNPMRNNAPLPESSTTKAMKVIWTTLNWHEDLTHADFLGSLSDEHWEKVNLTMASIQEALTQSDKGLSTTDLTDSATTKSIKVIWAALSGCKDIPRANALGKMSDEDWDAIYLAMASIRKELDKKATTDNLQRTSFL
jgi:hypothetical protein